MHPNQRFLYFNVGQVDQFRLGRQLNQDSINKERGILMTHSNFRMKFCEPRKKTLVQKDVFKGLGVRCVATVFACKDR